MMRANVRGCDRIYDDFVLAFFTHFGVTSRIRAIAPIAVRKYIASFVSCFFYVHPPRAISPIPLTLDKITSALLLLQYGCIQDAHAFHIYM